MNDKRILSAVVREIFETGDIENNCNKILQYYNELSKQDVDLVIFPDMSLCGYGVHDIALHDNFIDRHEMGVKKILNSTKSKDNFIIFGSISFSGEKIFRSVYIMNNGEMDIISKFGMHNSNIVSSMNFHNSDVVPKKIKINDNLKIGIIVGDDYINKDIYEYLCNDKDVNLLIILTTCPYYYDGDRNITNHISNISSQLCVPIIFLNNIGIYEDIIFGRDLLIANCYSEVNLSEMSWESCIVRSEWSLIKNRWECLDHKSSALSSDCNQNHNIYSALVLYLQQYFEQSHCESVVIRISDDIESILSLCIVTDALSHDNVIPIAMEKDCNLCDLKNFPNHICMQDYKKDIDIIGSILQKFTNNNASKSNHEFIKIDEFSYTNLISALCINNNYLALSYINKSDISIGKFIAHKDGCCEINLMGDLYKTQICELARWRNDNIPDMILYNRMLNIIPKRFLDTDEEYKSLDKILDKFIYTKDNAKCDKRDKNKIDEIMKLYYQSECKRRELSKYPLISEYSVKNRLIEIPMHNNYFSDMKKQDKK